MTVAPVRCPHCGAAVAWSGPDSISRHDTPTQLPAEARVRLAKLCNGASLDAAVLRTLVIHFGQNVPSEAIILACYGARDPPMTVENTIRVRISQLRHVVRPFGLVIANERYPCTYRLDRKP